MAEEFDPLSRMGQGNAYDDLVGDRVNKMKGAAAASLFSAGIALSLVIRLIMAGATVVNDNRGRDEIQRMLDAIQAQDGRLRIARLQIEQQKRLLADAGPGANRQEQRQRLVKAKAELKQLELECLLAGETTTKADAGDVQRRQKRLAELDAKLQRLEQEAHRQDN